MLLHERQKSAGAAFARVDGLEVARHYGDARREYDAVRQAVGVVARSDRAQLRMWGRDPVRMLNGLITNDLDLLSLQRAVFGVMLTPKGRIISDLRAISWGEGGAEVLLDIPAAAEESVGAHLKKFVPPLFARWEALGERVGCIGVYGPRSAELLSELLGEPVAPEEDRVSRRMDGSLLAIATRYAGGETGFDLLATSETLELLWDDLLARGAALGAIPVGHAALETLRIEAGQPRFGPEINDGVLAAEAFQSTGLMDRAISFTKGCYTGQEVVVRIAHRGHVNRHLRGVLLGEASLPEAGTPLVKLDGEKEVGRITSVAQSPLMGQAVALGYVRREVTPDERVQVGPGGAEGTVVTLPFPGTE